MFFEKNIQALPQTVESHADLVRQLQTTAPIQDFEFQETQDGQYTLRYRGVFLHDSCKPVEEARDAIRSQCKPGPGRLHLILGIGLGYLLDELFQASEGQIIVYEPDLPLLRFILDNVDLSEPLRSGRISLASSHRDVITLVRKQLYRQYQLDVLSVKGTAYLLADEIPLLMQALTELELDRVHDFKTGQAFHFQWLEQFFRNYSYFAQCPNADSLFHQFKDRPALVISRGPSLDQALDAIRDLAESVVLIAVGSAVHRLWEAGIIPDFAVFYDANGMKEQLHGIPHEVLRQIIFLVSPFTQQICYESPARAKYVFLAQNNAQFADVLDQTLHCNHQRLEGGGTVSLIAFQMALAMQCNPVILAGQDLAFPNQQVYAGGITLELDQNGAMALAKRDDLYTEPETMDCVLSQDGAMLPTLKAYKSFIRHFEDLAVKITRASSSPNQYAPSLYNASIGGAAIAGYPLKPLHEFLGVFPKWDKQAHLQSLIPLNEQEIKPRHIALNQALSTLKSSICEGLTLCNELTEVLHKASSRQQERIREIQSANRRVNAFMRLNSFPAYIVMFELMAFQEQIQQLPSPEALADTGFQALLRLLENCASIYRDKALPWIIAAENQLHDKSTSVPPLIIAD